MLTPLGDLNGKVFRDELHTQFTVHTESQPMQLELIEVTEGNDSPKIEFFSLHFRGPVHPLLAQQTHRLEHERLGTFEIFFTPISADGQGTVYEAIFHRFRKQS
ncbi:MAG TPA: hypothetical protein VKH81_10575 [Candidatus Angelobacter sp.]|nr:hypothetical protein [Candidatus Angelobacter sp.]